MAINDPSNIVGEALKNTDGTRGKVFVIGGLVIGLLVGLAQGPPMKHVCIRFEPGSFTNCAQFMDQVDGFAWFNQGAFGIVVGCLVGLVAYKLTEPKGSG